MPSPLDRILSAGLIAILRADPADPDLLLAAARALFDGGVACMEITLNTPAALAGISAIREHLPKMLCGAGTILCPDDARAAISAGARFIITPTCQPDTIRLCRKHDIPASIGCTTPTEAHLAHQAGAEFVKIFPASRFGLAHIRAMLAEMPMLRLVPTGGVTPENCADFFAAGCPAVAVGSNLIPKALLAKEDWPAMTELARRYTAAVIRGRV